MQEDTVVWFMMGFGLTPAPPKYNKKKTKERNSFIPFHDLPPTARCLLDQARLPVLSEVCSAPGRGSAAASAEPTAAQKDDSHGPSSEHPLL